MLIAVIPGKNYHTARQQIKQAALLADGIELRLDYWGEVNLSAVAALRCEFTLPMIFTLRNSNHGGAYPYDEAQRLETIRSLCQYKPDYLDLEYDIPKAFVQEIKASFPDIKLICSYHNFKQTPEKLAAILDNMQQPEFDYYKIATAAQNTLDALRMLLFVATDKSGALTGISMGADGQCTRILAPVVGSFFNYACLDSKHATAPGQMTLEDLHAIYHIHLLNSESRVYALLGDPVDQSVGHIAHNIAIRFLKQNAVYIKLRVTQKELSHVMHYCRQLAFDGFSVTMPLKEVITPFLDEIAEEAMPIQAINTVANYVGFNTDGLGALKALSERCDIAQQKIAIIGAGGAARAIAYAAVAQKATVVILNRTLERAQKLAGELGCLYAPLGEFEGDCTVLINTVPEKTIFEQFKKLPGLLTMDIVYSASACPLGYAMFIHQALLQIKYWFQPNDEQLEILKNALIYACKDNS